MSNSVSERTKQRRRILRAAAGAPVVFTLPIGSAVANTSVSCHIRSAEEFKRLNPHVIATASDEFVRLEVAELSMRPRTGSDREVLGFEFDTKYYEVAMNVLGRREATLFDPKTGGVDAPSETGQSYFILVNYNDLAGTLVLTDSEVKDPIAGQSCWNSLSGARIQF